MTAERSKTKPGEMNTAGLTSASRITVSSRTFGLYMKTCAAQRTSLVSQSWFTACQSPLCFPVCRSVQCV